MPPCCFFKINFKQKLLCLVSARLCLKMLTHKLTKNKVPSVTGDDVTMAFFESTLSIFFSICRQTIYNKPIFSIYSIIHDCILIFIHSKDNKFLFF